MKQFHHIALALAAYTLSLLLTACGKDFQDDIDKLNAKQSSIEQRVVNLETQVTSLNTQLGQLSVLATAVEQNFYITQVVTTADGYELTLSNGYKIVLQKMPDGTLTPMPAISMTQIDGLFYWTINGLLFTDGDGKPVRASGYTPLVKYDFTLQQWFISIDGGVTFQNVNTYASVIINDEVLLQVINNYINQHSTIIFSKQMLYQIISAYIQQNYQELFDIRILDEVVANYIDQHYTRLFSYELLEKIFKQYNYEYVTSNIKVDELVNVIVNFIREHNEVFENNEVLYEIISSYIQLNKTSIFTEELLLEVINNFIANNQNYIDVELLTQIVTNYVDVNRDVVFNTETVRMLHMEYLKKYYVQVFSQHILMQAVSTYVKQNETTFFNQTLLRETIENCVKNNYLTIFKNEVFVEIINNYIRQNNSTVFNHDILVEVITAYFAKNYNLIVDQTVISKAVNDYITKHKDTIISVEVVEQIVYHYLEQYYKEVFTVDMISQLIVNYFDQHTEVIKQYVGSAVDIVKSIKVDNELCEVTLRNGEAVQLVVYDAMTRIRDRIQSIVVMPNSDGCISYTGTTARIQYLFSPTNIPKILATQFKKHEVDMELKVTDGSYNVSSIPIYDLTAGLYGTLQLSADIPSSAKAVALYIKENKVGGSDVMTEFTVIKQGKTEPEKPKAYKQCPDGNHPHMIDLGLPSGTLWSCCNIGAQTPEANGDYLAWGEMKTKTYFEIKNYKYAKYSNYWNYVYIGNDIAGTIYDAAKSNWGDNWRMPTRIQCQELVDKCTYKEVMTGGYYYYLVTGPNGGAIKLPIAGCMNRDVIQNYHEACYWSSTISDVRNEGCAYGMDWQPTGKMVDGKNDNKFRHIGRLVRPVAKP